MTQADFNLDNLTGASFRTELNTSLQALARQSDGATEPTTTYPYQFWADTATGLLKIRNAANSGWIVVGTLATQGFGIGFISESASAPSSPAKGQWWLDTTNNILKLRSADNTQWIPIINLNSAAYQAAPYLASQMTGFVNRIINGGMMIDQMNEGASYSLPTNNTQLYTLDQWIASCLSASASGVTVQKVTDAPAGFIHSLKITVGTGASSVGSTEHLRVYQKLEGNHIDDLNLGSSSAVPMSLGFWVKASIAGDYAVTLYNLLGNRACVNKFTITTPGVWQYVKIQNIPGDQTGTWDSGINSKLWAIFTIATGSSYQTSNLNSWQAGAYLGSNTQTNSILTTAGATFHVTGVQLNPGVFTLPFEKRSMVQEMLLCQRYFEKTFNVGTAVAQNAGTMAGDIFILSVNIAAAVNYHWWQFKANKRTSPTLVTYNISAANASWRDTTAATDKAVGSLGTTESGAGIYVNDTTAISDNLRIHASANARM